MFESANALDNLFKGRAGKTGNFLDFKVFIMLHSQSSVFLNVYNQFSLVCFFPIGLTIKLDFN